MLLLALLLALLGLLALALALLLFFALALVVLLLLALTLLALPLLALLFDCRINSSPLYGLADFPPEERLCCQYQRGLSGDL